MFLFLLILFSSLVCKRTDSGHCKRGRRAAYSISLKMFSKIVFYKLRTFDKIFYVFFKVYAIKLLVYFYVRKHKTFSNVTAKCMQYVAIM